MRTAIMHTDAVSDTPTPSASSDRASSGAAPADARIGEAPMRELSGSSGSSAHAPGVPMLEVKGLTRTFGERPGFFAKPLSRFGLPVTSTQVHAVNNVDLRITKGTVMGLVGESGCGKSTLGRMVAGILPPTAGDVFWHGQNVETMTTAQRRRRHLSTQMVFQNPFASLNPRMTVADIVSEAPRVHGLIDGDVGAYTDAQLMRAGLDPSLKNRFAHQFSGGQRQRIGIARALAVVPDMLVCDEAVAALDVSIQAQIINLFMDLREQLDLTYLFISHDLGVVRHLSDRVAIMYLGRIVEEAPSADIFGKPNHPYTQMLLEEMPRIDTERRDFAVIEGELPSPLKPPSGCHFHPRCPHAMARCKVDVPLMRQVAPGHLSACHLNDQH